MAKEIKNEVVNVLSKAKSKDQKVYFVFNKEKYIIMLIGIGFILVGFLLMIGGGSPDPNTFSNELFSFRRITLAPILVLIGFVIEIYAIMKKPKEDSSIDITKNES